MKKRLIALTGLALLVFLGLIGLRIKQRNERQDALKKIVPPATSVAVQKPKVGRIAETLAVSGSVVAQEEVTLTPKASGRLSRLAVDEGSPVHNGQVLGEIEHSELDAQIAQARAQAATAQANLALLINGPLSAEVTRANAAVKQAEANLAQLQANLSHAESELLRQESLASQEVISRQQLDSARTQAEILRAQVNGAQQQVVSARASLKLVTDGARPEQVRGAKGQLDQAQATVRLFQAQRANYLLVSPMNGVVTEKHLDAGSVVGPGSSILTLSKLGQLEVELFVPERQLTQLRAGQEVTCTNPVLGEAGVLGHIRDISPVISAQTRLVKVKATLGGQLDLKAGMLMNCQVVLAEKRQALVLPPEALVAGETRPTVYLIIAGRVQARPVTIGLRTADSVEIRGGLKASEAVIVEGNSFVKPGDRVQVQPTVSGTPGPEVPHEQPQ